MTNRMHELRPGEGRKRGLRVVDADELARYRAKYLEVLDGHMGNIGSYLGRTEHEWDTLSEKERQAAWDRCRNTYTEWKLLHDDDFWKDLRGVFH